MEDIVFSLQDIRQTYEGHDVLTVPHLDIFRGKMHVILGPNGAGKSTLLRLLNLIEPPSSGSLLVEETPLSKINIDKTRSKMSMVFQKPYLYNMTVLNNVMLGPKFHGYSKEKARSMAFDALEMVGMSKFSDRNAKNLSGGESQRVALARAIAFNPTVLMLDEPTASLDPDNAAVIEDIIKEMKKQGNITLIMVTHNIFQAKRMADRIIFLYDGHLVEDGPNDKIFNSPTNPKTQKFISGDFIY